MMNFKSIFFFTIFIFISTYLVGSHIQGGDISVKSLGGGQYRITLQLIWDCNGLTMTPQDTIRIKNNCTGQTQIILATVTNPGGTILPLLCMQDSSNSYCAGGTLPGYELYRYEVNASLLPYCDDYTISYTTCCRDGSIINVVAPAAEEYCFQANCNLETDSLNNTPYFTVQAMPYVCINQPASYNLGVIENDGDSLVYSIAAAFQFVDSSIVYFAPFTGLVPITGMMINPQTGQLYFIPNLIGRYTVVVEVKEFERPTGTLLSIVRRDMPFSVYNCSNILPTITAGSISNLVVYGSVLQTGPYSLEMTEGSRFIFNSVFDDPNTGDLLSVNTNMDSLLAGGTYGVSGNNPVNFVADWTAPIGSGGNTYYFLNRVEDDFCPLPGFQTFVYSVKVLPSTQGFSSEIRTRNSAKLRAIPNPNDGNFEVELSKLPESELRWWLEDLYGQKLTEPMVTNSQRWICNADLKGGLYFLKAKCGDEFWSIKILLR